MAGARRARYILSPMNEKCFYADVELPFHVWVREGSRWVLRDARAAGGNGGEPPKDADRSAERGAAAR